VVVTVVVRINERNGKNTEEDYIYYILVNACCQLLGKKQRKVWNDTLSSINNQNNKRYGRRLG
jgi:hypothetical protein